LVIDPGSPYDDERARLGRCLDELIAEGRRPVGVFLTHHHGDHIGGAPWVARKLGVPILGHPLTLDRCPHDADVSLKPVDDGDRFELSGPLPMKLRAVFTPGHARGHHCLYEERSSALIAGDMISTLSTIVIDPPEGNLGDYLSSLERMRSLNPRTL